MKSAVDAFDAELQKLNTRKQRLSETYGRVFDSMQLMCAIADRNIEQIAFYGNKVSPWSNSKMTEGFINYLKGVAAYLLQDNDEAVYRFKFVSEHCSKTVIGQYASAYLKEMED